MKDQQDLELVLDHQWDCPKLHPDCKGKRAPLPGSEGTTQPRACSLPLHTPSLVQQPRNHLDP